MPHYVEWLIENKVIYSYSTGVMTIEEFESSGEAVELMMNESTAPRIHFILDDAEVEKIPQLSAYNKRQPVHPRIGIIFSCNTNPIQRFIGGILTQISKVTLKYTDTPEAALKKISIMEGCRDMYPEWLERLEMMKQQARNYSNQKIA